MPTLSDLDNIAKALYPNQTINSNGYTNHLTYTAGTATSLGLPEPYFWLWSGKEYSDHSTNYRSFGFGASGWGGAGRNDGGGQAVCVGD